MPERNIDIPKIGNSTSLHASLLCLNFELLVHIIRAHYVYY